VINIEVLENYNKTRKASARNLVCHAPSVNLNFEQNGNVTACCYNRSFVLGRYPEKSITEIWNGDKIKELRKYISEGNLSGGCSACEEVINSGNFEGSKARYFDEYAEKQSSVWYKNLFFSNKKELTPKVLEFEISNSCNLECSMCNGYFSSAIRKNREKLPALKNPYDEKFVGQVSEFLPNLSDAKFLGGEPFLIDLYYKIWDKIIENNTNIRVHITTNGTILNTKVKNYLDKLNAGIVLSIETLNKERFETIRKNASYEIVLKNIEYFKDYAKKKKTYFALAVCPIQQNWMDIPELVEFCNRNEITIHFNIVWTPDTASLKFFDKNQIKEVIAFYKQQIFSFKGRTFSLNIARFNQLIDQLVFWEKEQLETGQENNIQELIGSGFGDLEILDINTCLVLRSLLNEYSNKELVFLKEKITEILINHKVKETNFLKLAKIIGYNNSLHFFNECMKYFTINNQYISQNFQEKVEIITNNYRSLSNSESMDLVIQLNNAGLFYSISYINKLSFEMLSELINKSKN